MDQAGRSASSPLDHPIWGALATRQAHLALGDGPVRRFPPDMAPFIALDRAVPAGLPEVLGLVAPGERLTLVGPDPAAPPGCEVEGRATVTQMVWSRPVEGPEGGDDCLVLGPEDVPDMLALTALVYPAYFRARTIAMGTYLGIRRDGLLVAMAGQRLFLDGYREISGICTHPDHRGQGLARRLVADLVGRILAEELVPFLHVDGDNPGARLAYERMGFAARRDLALLRVRRP